MSFSHRNENDHIRRNPQDQQGKVRGGRGDLVGDEDLQAEEWEELEAEDRGETDSRIGDVGNAQSAMLGGTGDLDRVHRQRRDDMQEIKAANEDSPDLPNRRGTATPDSGEP